MRNLKKVLSLALALVMLLGMMVVGAGAATNFKDDSSIPENRAVAVAVANKIEVLLGDENGNFNPDNTLTRAEAAVVLAKLDLGADAAKALVATNAATFNDVGTGYGWAKAYIDYCAGNGYMVGVGGNNFAPGRTLTSVEFATMVSRVLGYKDENEYGKDGWTVVKAAALARKAGLGTDVAVASADMTRADMAQMVFNALTASMVEYTGLNGSIGDATFSSPATTRKHANDQGTNSFDYKSDRIVPNITPIRLCEEKFPDLKLNKTVDDETFGRTLSVWTWKRVEIVGTEVNTEPDATFTAKASESDVREVIGKAASKGNTAVYINGQYGTVNLDNDDMADYLYSSSTHNGLTQNGRLVEVYLNDQDKSDVDKIVVVDTALGEVTKVDAKNEKITIKLSKSSVADAVSLTTDVGYGDFEKGDIVRVTAYDDERGNGKIDADFSVVTVDEAEVVTGIAAKKYETKKIISLDGTEYTDAYGVVSDITKFTVSGTLEATLYLDEYGYTLKAVAGKKADTGPSDNVILVTGAVARNVDGKIVEYAVGINSEGKEVEKEMDGITNVAAHKNKVCYYDPADKDLTDINPNTASMAAGDVVFKDDPSTAPNELQLYWTVGSNENDTEIKRTDKKVMDNQTAASRAPLATISSANKSLYYSNDVKFIYLKGTKAAVADGMQDVEKNTANTNTDKWSQLVWVVKPNSKGDDGEVCAVFAVLTGGKAPVSSDSIIYVAEGKTWTEEIDGVERYRYENVYIDGVYVEDQSFVADIAGAQGKFYYVKQTNGIYMLKDRAVDSTSGGDATLAGAIDDIKVSGKYLTVKNDTNDLTDVETSDKTIYVNTSTKETMTKAEFLELAGEQDLIVDVYCSGSGDLQRVVAVYVTKKSEKVATATMSGSAATVEPGTAFKAPGATAPTSINNVAGVDWASPASNGMGFYFEANRPEDGDYTGITATLKITSAADSNVYTEQTSCTGSKAAVNDSNKFGGAFWIDYKAGTKNGGSGTLVGAASGLDIGMYSWTITVTGQGVVASGSFTITN